MISVAVGVGATAGSDTSRCLYRCSVAVHIRGKQGDGVAVASSETGWQYARELNGYFRSLREIDAVIAVAVKAVSFWADARDSDWR